MVSPDLVGAAATCVTIFMFLCPASAILRIHKAKSLPDDFNLYPYSFTALLATLWWYYGVIVEDNSMILTNAVGSVLECFYCSLLYRASKYSNNVHRTLHPIGGCGIFCCSVIAIIHFRGASDSIDLLGTINVIVNVATFATPLISVREVIRSKSCSSFPPIILQIAMTLTPTLWTIYATMIHDNYLRTPNALGIVLGSIQLILRCIYTSGQRANSSGSKVEL